MEPAPASTRRHDLDALRAFAMLLGIALHAALSFAGGPWMVQDSRPSGVFHLLIGAVHGFRMPLFFLLSGFFTAMLWRRRGLRALISHRFRRVFLPLLVGLVTIIPAMHLVSALAGKAGGLKLVPQSAISAPDLWKASAAGDLAALTTLLEAGADLNARDPAYGVTPLSLAATFGRVEVVKRLLEQGADVKQTNRDGGTALHGAAFLGRPVIVDLLLKAGVDPTAKNSRGETALDATLADWSTTEFVARMIQVPVEEETLLEGRREVRTLLGGGDLPMKSRPLVRLWLFLTFYPLFHHLWFLWFLCWMVAGFAVCAWIANRIRWQSAPRRWVNSPLRYFWLVPLTMIPAWFMGRDMPNFGPDTSSALLPPLHLLAYYAIFFGFGALYFDSHDERGSMGRRWWLTLPLALLVIYPAGLHATYEGVARFRAFAIFLQVISVWAMAPGWKFLIVCGGVFALLLVSYEYLVRYTWIGALLNGRKHRKVPTTQI